MGWREGELHMHLRVAHAVAECVGSGCSCRKGLLCTRGKKPFNQSLCLAALRYIFDLPERESIPLGVYEITYSIRMVEPDPENQVVPIP